MAGDVYYVYKYIIYVRGVCSVYLAGKPKVMFDVIIHIWLTLYANVIYLCHPLYMHIIYFRMLYAHIISGSPLIYLAHPIYNILSDSPYIQIRDGSYGVVVLYVVLYLSRI